MKLKFLLKDISDAVVKGTKDIEITGITSNSKFVSPSNIFVAKRGFKEDGAKYIPEAIRAGAVCVLTDIYDPTLSTVTQIIHPQVRMLEAQLAATYYDHPSEKLWMVGVTGTNGKTTVTYGIKHVLDAIQEDAGMIGTIEYCVGKARYEATRTTPDVCANHKLLREMVRHGCTSCAMEVTSHALDQERVSFIEFDVAVFTNLTHEHLDYHKTMEQYAAAKNRLFRSLGSQQSRKSRAPKWAVINMDDPWASKIIESSFAHVITYGIEKRADLVAEDIVFSQQGTTFAVSYRGEKAVFSWPLVGRFNVSNALAIMGSLLAKGISLQKVILLLKTFRSAPGRLEKVENPLGLSLFVDYAHSPDALQKVLETLRECTKGKIITVFGCGGERDKEKRPRMAHIVETLSDKAIITSDNPRSEDPLEICKEVITGFSSQAAYSLILDRKEAIAKAIQEAAFQDIVLIAGKGHETKQYIGNKIIDFDDRKMAYELACERGKFL